MAGKRKAQQTDDPTTPEYDARDSEGKFTKERVSPHPEIVSDNAASNKQAEDQIVKNQWLAAKQAGLLDVKGVEHSGLNQERPEGF